MKNAKILIGLLTAMAMVTSFTGCGIKFVERVPKETSSEPTITLPAPGQGEAVDKDDEDTFQVKDTVKHDGIEFKILDEAKIVYALGEYIVKARPSKAAATIGSTTRGEAYAQTEYALNGDWVVIDFNGESGFISSIYLSNKPVEELITTTKPIEDPGEVEENSGGAVLIPRPEETTSITANVPTVEQPENTKTTAAPDDRVSNIKYPATPPSISVNNGVNFADTSMQCIVIQGAAIIYDIPSAGGTALAKVNPDYEITCTGIGENGFCRVTIPDGRTGFIETMHLMKK